MKRLFVLVALLAFTATPARSQGLEFSAGVNFSSLSSETVREAARNIGMNLGIDFVIPVGPIGLNLGGGWSQKGVEQTVADARQIIDLSYIELPVHLRFPLAGIGPLKLNMVLGPTIGINTGCDIKIDQGAAEDCAASLQGFSVNNLDWSGTAGMGLSFNLAGLAYAGLDLVYSFGITSVSEGAAEALKNRSYTLQSHFGFDIF